ncbi:MAG: hypothetical protein GY913_02775 [Proteobacteria bacterium]|nr:hypothetical protein [Pseudomonadota bacterium]MCP4915822.1 hypothetical protein [Pseudomonadota bacterium]
MTLALLGAACSIALVHTLIGVDHYLPFVVLGKARGWSLGKVAGLTALCGLGHVIGSILLGFIGIGAGVALGELEFIEGIRGSLAAWGLIGFGLVYMAWSWSRLRRGHHHPAHSMTFWSIFIVFALGPCEPLIPLLMAPAFEHSWGLVAGVAGVFAAVTIGTMVSLACVGFLGLSVAPMKGLERYANVLAGGAIAASGLMIQVFGI